MNKLSLLTSATGVALLLAGVAPALALAEDSGAGAGVTNPATTVQTTGDGEQERQGPLNPRIPKLMASSTERMNKEHELQQRHELERQQHASTSAERMGKVQEKSGESIDKRIKSLQELSDRLAHMKLLPADSLATIQASIAAEIQNLTTLKGKIGTDTAKDTLKTDAESITKANRVYLLVMPKAQITPTSGSLSYYLAVCMTLHGSCMKQKMRSLTSRN